jgi:hypothetical protein
LSIGYKSSVSLPPAIQATGPLTLTPVGLPPTEHASLCWTHHNSRFMHHGGEARPAATSRRKPCGRTRRSSIRVGNWATTTRCSRSCGAPRTRRDCGKRGRGLFSADQSPGHRIGSVRGKRPRRDGRADYSVTGRSPSAAHLPRAANTSQADARSIYSAPVAVVLDGLAHLLSLPAKQRPLTIRADAGRFYVGVQIHFQLVMAGHFIDLAVLLAQAGDTSRKGNLRMLSALSRFE